MKLFALNGNTQKLDGGAMFGNAPKSMWQKWIAPDEQNRIALSCRCLLVMDGEKKILLEAGIGNFFSPELQSRYGIVENRPILVESLREIGIGPEEITDIILSHLHFDHAGGLLSSYDPNVPAEIIFPRAQLWMSKVGYERGLNPHPRDRASFIPRLMELLKNNPKVSLLEKNTCPTLGDNFSFIYSDGHTPGLLITKIKNHQNSVLFVSDLIPGSSWIHLPITMGYDRFPELVIDEKKKVLEECVQKNSFLFYTHDHLYAASKVALNQKGGYAPIDLVKDWKGYEL